VYVVDEGKYAIGVPVALHNTYLHGPVHAQFILLIKACADPRPPLQVASVIVTP
jgi:hypothetical protein